jgi:hypothetical protein
VKIHKHFDYTTPFQAAENADEMAEIMRLKYPRACSMLETGAEFFAAMVKDVQKFETWKLIGFETFEAFCVSKLGKTVAEVKEIVHGVELLGGNPTEAQAKEASRSDRVRVMLKERPELTQSEIAREVGVSHQLVSRVATLPLLTQKVLRAPLLPLIRLTLDPARVAAKIFQKMGEQYAIELRDSLETLLKSRAE